MLRLTRNRNTRISNRLAIVAAAVLMTTAVAGLSDPSQLASGKADLTAVTTATTGQSAPATAVSNNRLKKKFKVSLMLLPRR